MSAFLIPAGYKQIAVCAGLADSGKCHLMNTIRERYMRKLLVLALVAASLAACQTPGERAVGGGLIGGATGAAIGGLATGRASGALVGGAIGAVGGAAIGAATAPSAPACPYGTYQGYDGQIYCR
jgi:osmotically inducible lipoprotein OsmB